MKEFLIKVVGFIGGLHGDTGWDPAVGEAFKNIGDQFAEAGL